MKNHDILQSLGSLLHCVHADNHINADNAHLMYLALRTLMKIIDEQEEVEGYSDFNTHCWNSRERIHQGPLRFIKGDLFARPPEKAQYIQSVLCVPNTTSLSSSSKLVKKVEALIGATIEAGERSIGEIAKEERVDNRSFDQVWHLVCRNPGNPAIHGLRGMSEAFGDYEQLTEFRIPLFGGEASFEEWKGFLDGFVAMRKNIQHASSFIDFYWIQQEEPLVRALCDHLRSIGAKFTAID